MTKSRTKPGGANGGNDLRGELYNYFTRAHTHASFLDAVKGVQEKIMNEKVSGVPYSLWGLLEHIRATQHDMLDFITNPDYKSLSWPDDYWPDPKAKTTKKMWVESVKKYAADLDAFKVIIKDPTTDLSRAIARGDGQTIFREALQIIDHASYHTGEFILLRRALGSWKK